MQKLDWFQRTFQFGLPLGMLPFYLERLSGTAPRMAAKVKDVPDEWLSFKPGGKWSAKENLAHLAEVDEIALRRIHELVNGAPVLSPAVFGLQRDYNVWPAAQVIEMFRDARERNLARYRALTDQELMRTSMHPRLKVPITAVDLAWFDAEHDDHHMARATEILHTFSK